MGFLFLNFDSILTFLKLWAHSQPNIDKILIITSFLFCIVDLLDLLLFVIQSLAVVTLGDKQMAQRVDNLVGVDEVKRFYLQVTMQFLSLYH